MLDEFGQAYIVTARSKGLTERVINFRHVLKNASIPIVTILGLRLGGVIGGTVVVETVFAWPGIGWLMMESITTRDLPVIRAIVLVMAMLFVFINLTVDILYTYLDPRVRYK
jgi:ABC-type dipeptide/oligopeptide/nickel transport system permease component